MKALAGAVLILAAAILLGAATVARAVTEAANINSGVGKGAELAALVVGLLGLGLLVVGLAIDSLESWRRPGPAEEREAR